MSSHLKPRAFSHMPKVADVSQRKFLAAVVLDEELGKRDLRVALFLLLKGGTKDWVELTQEQIGEELSMSQPHIAESLKRLKKKYVARSKTKRPRAYKLKLPPT